MIGIFFGSTTGNTEQAAQHIQKKLQADADVINVTEMTKDNLEKYDMLLLGSSTWGSGDLQDDWETRMDVLESADLSGKKVGFFGCGDQSMYPDTFADALGIIYRAIKDSGAEFIGEWPAEEYDYTGSEAVVNGSFIGLVLDEDNQSDLTEQRIADWTATLK